MKKAALLLLCVFALLLLTGAKAGAPESEYRVVAATDLHYIAPALTDHGPLFTGLTANADGKLMRWSEEITDAFLDEVVRERPDALVLTGDLTFNGALLSHTALAQKLRRAEAAGVPVFVLPGNHDLNNPGAASFSGESYQYVPSAAAEDFRRIYAEFGFDEALSADTDSLAYTAALNDTTWLLMLDFNTDHDPCGVSEKTLEWMEEQLAQARRAGVGVLAAGHQNLFQHSMFSGGYVIRNADRLAALLRQYGVPLFLSGHLHTQHRITEEGLTEIVTSALSVTPCHYALLTARNGQIRYEARETDVAAWARERGRAEPELLDFPDYAAAYFDARAARQVPEELSLYAYTQEEIDRMTDYLVRLNRGYFSGDLRGAADLDQDGELEALWRRCPSLYGVYLDSIRPDFGMDYRYWESG